MSCNYVVDKEVALPTNSSVDLFEVSGGRVVVDVLFGEITDAVTADNSFTVYAYNGASQGGALTDSVPLNGAGVGILFANGLAQSSAINCAARLAPVVVQAGRTLKVHSGSTATTGSVRFTVSYRPLDPGAAITAA